MKLLLLPILFVPLLASAQTTYRCPGPPELLTNMLSADEAKAKRCRAIEGASVTVLQTPRRAAPAPAAKAPGTSGSTPASGPTEARERIDPNVQKARDSDRRAVLEAELRSAEAKLAELKKEYADGQPERRGDERNYQKYLDRVEQMKAALTRQEADVAAIKRELTKAP